MSLLTVHVMMRAMATLLLALSTQPHSAAAQAMDDRYLSITGINTLIHNLRSADKPATSMHKLLSHLTTGHIPADWSFVQVRLSPTCVKLPDERILTVDLPVWRGKLRNSKTLDADISWGPDRSHSSRENPYSSALAADEMVAECFVLALFEGGAKLEEARARYKMLVPANSVPMKGNKCVP